MSEFAETVRTNLLEFVFALFSGVLFGFGLAFSGMANPAKVLAFLDIAGKWDPTLAFVMLGALAVSTPAFHFILKRPGPLFSLKFVLPTLRHVDTPLVVGSAIFGVGWGLAGLCPGPAITDLVTGDMRIFMFVGAMLVGAFAANLVPR